MLFLLQLKFFLKILLSAFYRLPSLIYSLPRILFNLPRIHIWILIFLCAFVLIMSFIPSDIISDKEIKRELTLPINNTLKSKYAVALGVGLVPCPGVMTIVLFCIMLKKFTLGIMAAVAMSIGMGLTISVVGILSVLFANKTSNFVNRKAYILEVISGLLIIVLGIFLYLSIRTH